MDDKLSLEEVNKEIEQQINLMEEKMKKLCGSVNEYVQCNGSSAKLKKKSKKYLTSVSKKLKTIKE